jgi:hypothetical protein
VCVFWNGKTYWKKWQTVALYHWCWRVCLLRRVYLLHPKNVRLSKPTDMTIHWKALEQFLELPFFSKNLRQEHSLGIHSGSKRFNFSNITNQWVKLPSAFVEDLFQDVSVQISVSVSRPGDVVVSRRDWASLLFYLLHCSVV